VSSDLFDSLVAEIGKAIAPLRDAIAQPWALERLLAQIGVNAQTAGGDDLVAALRSIVSLADDIEQLAAAPEPSFSGLTAVLEALRNVVTALRELSGSDGPVAAFESFGTDLIEVLLIQYLWNWHPLAHEVAVLATLIEPAGEVEVHPGMVRDGEYVRMPFAVERLRIGQLSALIKDPDAALRAEYGNPLATVADANTMADKLFPRLLGVLRTLGVTCRYGFDPADAPLLGDSAPFVDHSLIVYTADQLAGAAAEAGVVLTISSADRGDLGFIFRPFGSLSETWQLGNWNVEIDLTADVEAFAVGRHGVIMLVGSDAAELAGQLTATLAAPEVGPAYLVGSATGSRIEVGGVTLALQTTLSEERHMLALSATVTKAAIVIASADGDGFLHSILPADGLRIDFDLGIAWSNTAGLSFKGAAGLQATLPVDISVAGIVRVPSVHILLDAADSGARAEISLAAALSIGPVQVLVDRIGVTGSLTSPAAGGNLGPADFSFAFKPPSGVGLAIDAAGVSGGGFVRHDDATQTYSGVLQLEFTDLALQAFGLISTQTSDGTGYSLLALVDADFPPVQLGWGFTLDGVGGLLAVHRTASVDALRAALKADQLGTVLFPKNAITDAPRILAQLAAMFPAAPGQFLFGPMVLIGWGTPTVLTAAIAVVLELPEPVRLLLLARVAVRAPSELVPLVHINMDALGVLDLSGSELSLDAALFDSNLAGYTLSGEMSLRATWAAQREFLLAIGGFHPRFQAPAGFPPLRRVTIDMPGGVVSKLRLAAYLAITSNSVQLGADLDVFVGAAGFGLSGNLGFDALLQFDPFHFEADISGKVAITFAGEDLASVSLDATLTGPAPWNIAGHFKIHVVFFDVHKSFSASWGEDALDQAVASVDVGQLLSATLADPRSWDARLPDGVPALAAVRRIEDPGRLLAHPLARLEVHERIVPLGLDISRFGAAAPSGARRFAITDFRVGGTAVAREAVLDDFAPAQFFALSEEEKLERPSFERHDAGVITSGSLVTSGRPPVAKTIAYETLFIDVPGGAPRTEPGTQPQPLPLTDIAGILEIGSAARAVTARTARRRYSAPGNPVRVAEPLFALADAGTLASAGIGPAAGATFSEVQAMLDGEIARAPGQRDALLIVATHEMTAG
jgi:hypothetical protein